LPELPFLGVHVTEAIDGRVTLGPTALLVGARDAYLLIRVRPRHVADIVTWPGVADGTHLLAHRIAEALMAANTRRLVRAAARYVPAVETIGVRGTSSAGVRARAVGRDGVISHGFPVAEVAPAVPGAVLYQGVSGAERHQDAAVQLSVDLTRTTVT
jgi:L-2-hydroxyglutarate oxidase